MQMTGQVECKQVGKWSAISQLFTAGSSAREKSYTPARRPAGFFYGCDLQKVNRQQSLEFPVLCWPFPWYQIKPSGEFHG